MKSPSPPDLSSFPTYGPENKALTGSNIYADSIVRGYPNIHYILKLTVPYMAPDARLERLPRPVDIYPLIVGIYRLARSIDSQFGWSQKSYTICQGGTTTAQSQFPTDVEFCLSYICCGLPEHILVRIFRRIRS